VEDVKVVASQALSLAASQGMNTQLPIFSENTKEQPRETFADVAEKMEMDI